MIPDKAYEVAVMRLKELQESIGKTRKKLAGWEREHAELEAFVSLYHKLAGVAPLTGLETPPPADPNVGQNPKREDVGKFATELIARLGRPVQRRELLQQLDYAGLHIHGVDPMKVLSTMMWRMKDRFVLLKGFGYWLADRGYAPAHYAAKTPPELAQADIEELMR
jgi:hypothetical protein